MIETLQIQNFQNHRRTRIDFAPDITTVVGQSDAGKSAIIRALRWVITNSPQGDWFIRRGAKGATVSLRVDGHTIKRRRGAKGINEYKLDDRVLVAFGRGVPDHITNLLAMGPTNWQHQHDAPFWFGLTAGEVSRQLNAIIDLGVIDQATAHLGKHYRHCNDAVATQEGCLSESHTAKKQLAWVVDCDRALVVVEGLQAEARHKATDAAVLTVLVNRAKSYAATAKQAQAAHTVAVAASGAVRVAVKHHKRAASLADMIKAVEWGAAQTTQPPDLSNLQHAWADAERVKKARRQLAHQIDIATQLKATQCQAQKTYSIAKKRLGARCPTCGATSTAKAIT